MGTVPDAFSVHHFINSVGADAGFAAIVGLAILVLLYFAQARETSALRDQAQEWAQRVQQLEARLARLSRAQAPADTRPPTPPPPGFRQAAARTGAARLAAPAVAQDSARAEAAAPAGGAAGLTAPAAAAQTAPPSAPAGVAAPALTAATRLIPSSATAASGETAASAAVTDGQTSQAPVVSPPPAPTPAGGNGVSSERVPPPASYAGGRSAAGHGSSPPPRRVQFGASAPDPRSASPLQGLGLEPDPTRRMPPALAFLLAGLALAAVVAVLVIVTSGSSNSTSRVSAQHANAGAQPSSAAVLSPSSVTVAVLNGTATSGLAAHVSQRLAGDGYKKGMVGNAADETHTSTVVAFAPGSEQGAIAVAKSLGLSNASVQQVDHGTLQIACPPPSRCAADVVVTVGSDLASSA